MKTLKIKNYSLLFISVVTIFIVLNNLMLLLFNYFFTINDFVYSLFNISYILIIFLLFVIYMGLLIQLQKNIKDKNSWHKYNYILIWKKTFANNGILIFLWLLNIFVIFYKLFVNFTPSFLVKLAFYNLLKTFNELYYFLVFLYAAFILFFLITISIIYSIKFYFKIIANISLLNSFDELVLEYFSYLFVIENPTQNHSFYTETYLIPFNFKSNNLDSDLRESILLNLFKKGNAPSCF
ncbi:hypothetical protein [Spiroplasma chrysopicola]|uniref:Transmembrane protein n=1 Tax=Spiroplasma chrysopicola DF-1 TaxID=1276227 RepID=R4U3Y4_9MOLU|nr:hypothetical protein [Spiroplasma chrysopicola]AGM25243.1 hypothetical protein SCHRY_v1c06670 [Spiroplasma chrysopicola DF-1]